MARVGIVIPPPRSDLEIEGIFNWARQMEGTIPNHFYVELNFPDYFKAKLTSTKVLWRMGELSIEEVQHIGILVSKANGCSYCTAAFCAVLNHGLGTDEAEVKQLLLDGASSTPDPRLSVILEFCLKVNDDPGAIDDTDIEALRDDGLTDKEIVQGSIPAYAGELYDHRRPPKPKPHEREARLPVPISQLS